MKHSLVTVDEKSGKTRIDYRDVAKNTLTNEVKFIPLKQRVY